MKRAYVIAGYIAIISPLLPFVLLHAAAEQTARFIDWCFRGRSWVERIYDRAERFAEKRGVRL